jgi:hypothetical protein
MSFALRNLCVLAYANGFTLWHYKAGADPLEEVGGQGFFADAADMLSPGDMIMISARNGSRIAGVERHRGQPALAELRI